MSELIVGIDLGTTNSEIAAFHNGKVEVLGPAIKILPSCVAFSPSGELLVGDAARNQFRLYPERTVRSIKRRMGTPDKVTFAGRSFTPPEISAMILNELVEWAAKSIGERPKKAVITVPAYFSDAQRSATREAGAIAGLDVIRILNEPTAASLAYGYGEGKRHTAMVYDLGGGTFDVSIVTIEGDVTEVLASHGNNHLGGDDFDDLLAARLADIFRDQHGVDARIGHPAAKARLWWAAEEAKKRLSYEPYVKIVEENLIVSNGRALHLETEIAREDYEDLIRPLVESTLDSVSKALQDARKRPGDLDAILLVGGSTRTPLVSSLLRKYHDLEPRRDVHPDLCVALGAGVLASRLAGHEVDRVLVDVTPYSFGVSYLGDRDGNPYSHCYKAIVERNTPLPVTRTERYYTASAGQVAVDIEVFQGDDPDAMRNILVGSFRITGLAPTEEPNEVLCRMRLDIDGILEVAAIEKKTGMSKQITITNALKPKSEAEIRAAQERLRELFESRRAAGGDEFDSVEELLGEELDDDDDSGLRTSLAPTPKPAPTPAFGADAKDLMDKARRLLDLMHPDDKEETINMLEEMQIAINLGDREAYQKASGALKELLFFVGGKE